MIFGAFALADALGAVLAHSHRLPGRVLKKGSVLDASTLDALRAAGVTQVIAARFDPDDVAENDAAETLAACFDAPGLARGRAGTGRVNLHATQAGLLVVDTARIDAINAVHESLTVATLPDSVVAAKDMVATIKVIPFAVPGAVLRQAQAAAIAANTLKILPFQPLRVGLVLSELPGLKQSVIDGTIEATRTRIEGLGGILLPPIRCAHTDSAIADSLRTLLADGAELLLVAGASATVDRRDVGPAAVVAAGGEITHFGMPVDPGNLICLGRVGGVHALVLPGCARSPKANGIDLVLRRIFAGLPVGPEQITRMGVGGLLKDTEARPLPRARAAPKPAGKMVAAGTSTRMAPHHKLLVDVGGKPMIARVVDNVLSSQARPVIVVTGHRDAEIQAALAGRPVQFVFAPDHAAGLSASLKAGITALPAGCAAALVCLGDMPLVTGRLLDQLIAAHDADEGRRIVVPMHDGQRGNPVLWDRSHFAALQALTGDAGAKTVLRANLDDVVEVAAEIGVLRDFDTPESLATLPTRLRPSA